MGKETDLIGVGAVALLAIIGYNKVKDLIPGSSSSSSGGSSGTFEQAKEIISGNKELVTETPADPTKVNQPGLDVYDLGVSENSYWAKMDMMWRNYMRGNTETPKAGTSPDPVSVVSKPKTTSSYVGSDAGYGSVSPAASATRVSGSNVVIPSSGVGSAAGYGSVSPAASIVRSNKTSSTKTSTPTTYKESGLTKYKDATGKVHVMVK